MLQKTRTPLDPDADAPATIMLGSGPAVVFGKPPRRSRNQAARPLVLLLHGGAFLSGSPTDVLPLASALAQAGSVVVTPSYPIGPEHPFPAALDALWKDLQVLNAERATLAGKDAPLVVAGLEAGANLAAALALKARDLGGPKLAAQVLVTPMLDPSMGSRAMRTACLGAADCVYARGWSALLPLGTHAPHPYAAPAISTRAAGLPPALILTAKAHPLHDDALGYARGLRNGGVEVQQVELATTGGQASPSPTAAGPITAFFARHTCKPAAQALRR
jgi:acetyl esterase